MTRAGGLPPRGVPAGGGTLAFLAGRWRIDRRLDDRRAAASGRFTGLAGFTAVPGGLRYREDGELRFGGHAGPAWRELRYLAGPDGTADVRFADGRPFYRLDLRAGRWQARHECGQDLYLAGFEVLGDDLVTEHWRVRGPDKDYDSFTELRRLAAGADDLPPVSPPSWPSPPG